MTENETHNIKNSVKGVVGMFIVLGLLVAAAWFFRLDSGAHRTTTGGSVSEETGFRGTVLRSDVYGFEITVPAGATPEVPFKKYHILSDTWRVNAPSSGAGSKGTAVVAIPLLRLDEAGSGQSAPKVYPLYFDTEVRVGVSSSTADCYKKDEGYSDQKVTDVTLNGVAFKKFSFGGAAMMQYIEGESYRTIHGGLCYVVEQVKAGSSYREPSMEEALSDSELAEYYAQVAETVKTFKFVK